MKTDQKILEFLKRGLQEIFSDVDDFSFSNHNKSFSFSINSNELTFNNLQKVSELLGTEEMNFSNYTRENKLSSWTNDVCNYTTVRAYNIDLEKIYSLMEN